MNVKLRIVLLVCYSLYTGTIEDDVPGKLHIHGYIVVIL